MHLATQCNTTPKPLYHISFLSIHELIYRCLGAHLHTIYLLSLPRYTLLEQAERESDQVNRASSVTGQDQTQPSEFVAGLDVKFTTARRRTAALQLQMYGIAVHVIFQPCAVILHPTATVFNYEPRL